MQTTLESLSEKKSLLFTITTLSIFFLTVNLFHHENFQISEDFFISDIAYVITPGAVMILSLILSIKNKGRGSHGKAWVLFFVFAVCWFVGEQLPSYSDYNLNNVETITGDIFIITGYPFFFAFTLLYLKPFRKEISPKVIIIATMISVSVVVPSMYMTFFYDEDLQVWEIALLGVYPILDGIVLIPSLIGVWLFFNGRVNLPWSLFLLAWIVQVLAETSYLICYTQDRYMPCHESYLFYIVGYVLMGFGLYYYIKMGKSVLKKSNSLTQ